MSRIFELNETQESLLNRLYWLNDDETDDLEEIASIKKELTKVRDSAENTVEFLSGLLLNFQYDIDVYEDEQRRLLGLAGKANKRRQKAEKNAERIESIMLYMLKKFDLDKVSSKHGVFTPTITPGAVKYSDNFDVNNLPAKFVELVPEYKIASTKEIMAFLRANVTDKKNQTIVAVEELPGVTLVRKEGIKVK